MKKLFILFFMMLMSIIIVHAQVECYQETATSNASGCGLPTGVYANQAPYFYVNYTLPYYGGNQSLWTIKISNESVHNVTIPQSCDDFASNTSIMSFRLSSYKDFQFNGNHYARAYCHNMTDWELLEDHSKQISGAQSTTGDGSSLWYDASYTSGVCNDDGALVDTVASNSVICNYASIYEEGMYWIEYVAPPPTPMVLVNDTFEDAVNRAVNDTVFNVTYNYYNCSLIGLDVAFYDWEFTLLGNASVSQGTCSYTINLTPFMQSIPLNETLTQNNYYVTLRAYTINNESPDNYEFSNRPFTYYNPCVEFWVEDNTVCNGVNYTIQYADINTCGTSLLLPGDNGTLANCTLPATGLTAYQQSISNDTPMLVNMLIVFFVIVFMIGLIVGFNGLDESNHKRTLVYIIAIIGVVILVVLIMMLVLPLHYIM